MNDEGPWIVRAKAGDPEACRWLYDRYRTEVFRLCFRFCRNETMAEDIAQEVFLRVFGKLHTFRGRCAFSTWLYRVTANEAMRRVASAGRRKTFDLTESHASNTDDTATEIRLDLKRAIDGLPARMRSVLILYTYAGYSHEEIGTILGIAPGTSKAHLHRAKHALRKELSDAM